MKDIDTRNEQRWKSYSGPDNYWVYFITTEHQSTRGSIVKTSISKLRSLSCRRRVINTANPKIGHL
jgi:hypothetical protein